VPAYALAASGLLPEHLAIALGVLIVVTGSLYFADGLMKTSDHYFRGFPALWNIAAFYLFVLKPGQWISAAIVVVLSALTFVPFHVIHPVRIAHLRAVTTAALVVWAMLAILTVAQNLDPASWTVAALCLLALYFVIIGFLRRHRP
jgi:phosphatidylcholine synthase